MPPPCARPPWWRSPTVVIVAGCLIAIITFGVRTSFGLFTDAAVGPARLGPRDVRARDRGPEPAVGPRPAVRGRGRRPLRRRARARGRRRRLRARRRADVGQHPPAALALTGGVLVGLGLAGGSFTIVIAAFARLVRGPALVGDGPRDRRRLDGPVPVRPARPGLHRRPTARPPRCSCSSASSRSCRCWPRCADAAAGEDATAGEPPSPRARRCGARAHAPELPAAHLRLLRLRLPHRVHHHAPAGVPDRPGAEQGPRRVVAGADRPVQRDRRLLAGHPRRHLPQAPAAERDLPRPRRRLRALPACSRDRRSPCSSSPPRSACCGSRPCR